MSLIEHARTELHKAGLFDSDSDYGGNMGNAVMEMIETFSAQGHSGFSAHWAVELFLRLANFDVLTPLTDDPSEWMEIGQDMSFAGNGVRQWQSRRKPSCFSHDAGKSFYDVDERTEGTKWPPPEPHKPTAKSERSS